MIPCIRWRTRLLALALLAVAPQVAQAQACPLSVDASGAGHFTSIQAAVNHFKSTLGNLGPCTIDVQPGIYAESLVVANTPRSFTVRGAGAPGLTIIDAVGKGAPVLNLSLIHI